jgi:hypothetical protein
MSKSTPAELNEFGTTATESLHDHDGDAADCPCQDGLACFDVWMAERDARGEF